MAAPHRCVSESLRGRFRVTHNCVTALSGGSQIRKHFSFGFVEIVDCFDVDLDKKVASAIADTSRGATPHDP